MTRRLVFSYLSVTLFVLVVLEVPFGAFVATLERERLLIGFERNAVVLASIYEDALDLGEPYDPKVAADWADATDSRVVVVGKDGVAIVDTAGAVFADFSNRPEIAAALAGARTDGVRSSVTLGEDLMFVAVPVASGGEVHGAVRITFSPAKVETRIHRFWLGLAGVGLVVMAAMALVGLVIAHTVRRPLVALRDGAARAAAGDLTVEIDPGDAPEEVADVATAFNHMVARVRELVERERRFASDVSHQLRTPLTGLRLRLENLEACVTTGSAEVAAALREVERLGTLVEQLLALARSDRPNQVEVEVDLSRVAEERRALWEVIAEERQVRLVGAGLEAAAPIAAVDGAVEQIIDNLLENALNAATPETVITIRIDPDRTTLRVVDQGPGMTAEQRGQAFERFWRGERQMPGTGLGLAIVRELAKASGATARLEAAEGGGVEAVVAFRGTVRLPT